MARAQTQDTDVQAFQTAITGLTIRPIQIHNSGPVLLCDVSLGHPQPIVPRTFQRHVFEAIHNLAHPGRKSTVKHVANKFVWHGVKKQESVNPNSRLHSSNNLFHSLAERFPSIPTSHHGLSTPSIPSSLKNARFVFVRRDCHRGPLQRPYNGPYRVITPGPKTFRVMIGRREEVISIDRLKPAHVDLTQPVLVAQPRRRGRPHITQNQELFTDRYAPLQSNQETTRSGRHVRLPLRFQ
ncbi:hypothetical protein RRG08_040441 [Elysia crispata]|nr:hypothetical protein RRG08_040441 [Elysia crispata]